METDAEDSYLVQRAQEGYLDAYSELVARYAPQAYRVALRLLGNHHDAEDIAQESLVAVWQHLVSFKAESSFPTWLYQIVTRRALNRITRARPVSSLDLLSEVSDQDAGPAVETERSQATDAVSAAVAALPPLQRVAVVLHYFEGLPYEEIVRITGMTLPAVRSHLYRGRRALAETLAEWR